MTPLSLSTMVSKYDPKKKKLENYLKRATQLRLDAVVTNTKSHLLCNLAKDMIFDKKLKDMVILQCMLQMADIMPTKSNSRISQDILYDIGCGRYGKNKKGEYEFSYEYLFSSVQEQVENKNMIFIMFGMQEYCLIEGVIENFYSTHSTCLLLVPRQDHYDAYYINSHGRDMCDTTNFVRKVSRKRTNTVSFDRPWEFIFLHDLIEYWNTYQHVNIKWDTTPKHTYYDTDLQAGDYWGVCFTFPQIILHTMGEFYTKKKELKRDWGSLVIDDGETLLKKGNLAIFVKSAFTHFSSHYDATFAKNIDKQYSKSSDDPLNTTLEKRRTAFIKSIICSLVRYMGQKFN